MNSTRLTAVKDARMPMDPYTICPCGSGKKLKFCCQSLSNEMEKVEKLIDNHQPRMALQILEKLAKTNGQNPWVVTRQAASLMSDDRAADAKNVLLMFLRHRSDHPSANALYAMATLQSDGLPEARKAIRRAFRFSIAAEPVIVAGLAQYLAEYHWQLEQFMAARQHMVMALQLGNENQRQEVLQLLTEFDADASVPFSFRGGQAIPPYTPPEAAAEKVNKAQRLASVGCWGDAATLLTEAAEQHDPNSTNLWRLIGLFRAWDGEEATAAAALHKAAELDSANFEAAVETEALAQELDRNVPENCTKLRTAAYDTEHVSRLLGKLDESPLLVKIPSQPPQEGDEQPVAGIYAVLDRQSADYRNGMTLRDLSRIVGRITVLDSNAEKALPPRVLTTALEGKKLTHTKSTLETVAGDLVHRAPNDPPEGSIVGVERPDDEPMTFDYYMPKSIPAGDRRRLRREFLDMCWGEGWKKHPLRALGGKTPAEVAADPNSKIKLAAAIDCLEAVADDMNTTAPIEALRQEFGIPAFNLITITNDHHLQSLTLSQLRRVDVRSLNLEMFKLVVQRASLARMGRLANHALKMWLVERDSEFSSDDERLQIMASLADLNSRSLHDAEAMEWNKKARQIIDKLPNAFERVVEWKLRELQLQLSDKEKVNSLFRELWEVYGAKLPRLRQILAGIIEELGIERPFDQGIVTTTTDVGGLWSPDAPAEAPAGQKLWLPENG
jgi:hypothetical protein